MDIFRSLQVYLAVVRHMSFANGARELGISTTSASRHIQDLEHELGARLINRTTRKLHITEVGLLVYANGRELLAGVEDLRSSVSSLSHSVRGTLRVTCPVSLGVRLLMPMMADFNKLYPGMIVEVSLTNRFIDLIDEGFDVAIRLGREMPSTSIAKSLGEASSTLCAAPSYLSRIGRLVTPQDLRDCDHVLYKSSRQTIDAYELTDDDGITTMVEVKGRLYVDSTDAMREAVLHGCGIGIFPRYTIANDLVEGRLIPVLSEYHVPGVAVSLVYPHRRHLSRKTRVFVDFLSANVRLT